MRREIVFIRIPQTVNKVIKGADTRGVTKIKTTKNGIKRIDFKLCSPFREGSNLKGK